MLGLAFDDGGLGGAERRRAALCGDGLFYQVDARLRRCRLHLRRTQHECDSGYENTPHGVLPIVWWQRWLVRLAVSSADVSHAKHRAVRLQAIFQVPAE